MKTKKEDIIYAAGFFDGEGCITTSGTAGFRVTISSTDKEILLWFQDEFGGCINNQYLPLNPKWSCAWKWILTAKKPLTIFLSAIYPYLKLKQKEAEKVLQFLKYHQDCKIGRKISPEEMDLYLTLKNDIHLLKSRNKIKRG